MFHKTREQCQQGQHSFSLWAKMPLLLQMIQKLYQENNVWPKHISRTARGSILHSLPDPLYPAWTLSSLQFQWTPTSLQNSGHNYQLGLSIMDVLPTILHMPKLTKINPTQSGEIVRKTPLHRANSGEIPTFRRIRLRKRKPAAYHRLCFRTTFIWG